MLFARHDMAVERLGNVVHPQPEMVLRRDIGRTFQTGLEADQRYDVARAGVFDGLVQAGKRANVNH